MRTNLVKRKLKAGEPSFGSWLSFGDLFASRALARVGYDWLTLDLEHGAIDWSNATAVFGMVADSGCVPLARVPQGSHDYIKRVLDAGAWGIVVPMVDTVEQARIAVAAAKYPPQGNRSVGGGMHMMNFNADPSDYQLKVNDEILVVLQTESPRGVDNAEEIYSVPGVDAIFVGPVDLRANMPAPPGKLASDEELEEMLARVVAAGKKTGTPTGMHVQNVADAKKRAEQGMQFLAVGSDLSLMLGAAKTAVAELYPDREGKLAARY
jgi:4-hydroxy-2-oxoheptanedioate aldolase